MPQTTRDMQITALPAGAGGGLDTDAAAIRAAELFGELLGVARGRDGAPPARVAAGAADGLGQAAKGGPGVPPAPAPARRHPRLPVASGSGGRAEAARHPSAAQFRAARAWLGWSRGRAGHLAGMCQQTVGSIERDDARTSGQMRAALRAAYEAHGADFGDGRGVRFEG